jgi:ribonuclease-3
VAGGDLAELADRLGYRFRDRELLECAVTHRSWCAEHPGARSNERLEFLGDAVLGWVVADLAYHRFSDLPEGRMTDLRKAVVNARALAQLGRDVGLGSCLRLGRGEDHSAGREKESILSDALEAVLGAVYLDGGADAAVALVHRLVIDILDAAAASLDHLDHKTRLQEIVAQRGTDVPVYEVTGRGPDHDRVFTAVVSVAGRELGRGEGRSKKMAEQVAAAQACGSIDEDATPHA